MINDYSRQLEVFAYPESRKETQAYMEKYWLHSAEYSGKWRSLQTNIFEIDKYFPDMVFKPELDILIMGGGVIFSQDDFESFKNCLRQTQNEEFVIIQNIDEKDPLKIYVDDNTWIAHPALRFKYPANIEWSELLSGGGVSDELFKVPYKDYLVFGNKGGWGICG